jgi:hypothetical protein
VVVAMNLRAGTARHPNRIVSVAIDAEDIGRLRAAERQRILKLPGDC